MAGWGGLEPRSGLLKVGQEGKAPGAVHAVGAEILSAASGPEQFPFLLVSQDYLNLLFQVEVVRQRHRKKHPVPPPAGLSGPGTDSVEGGGWEAGDGVGGSEVRRHELPTNCSTAN